MLHRTIKAAGNGSPQRMESQMAELKTQVEDAVAELTKLQGKAIAQANALFEEATRVAREQIAFAEQLGSEWRKLVLASAKSASEMFAPKA
jgi:hypothetical protein